MTAIRTRRYRVSPERFEEFSVRRVAVIEAVRARDLSRFSGTPSCGAVRSDLTL